MEIALPLDYTAIERILPHRYPFLLVDRITEFEPDKRIVGIKNVSMGDRFLSAPGPDGRASLPTTVLTEAVAQVGAILILAKPENKDRLIFFMASRRSAFAAQSIRATSSSSKPGSSACAAAWACCRAAPPLTAASLHTAR